MKYKLAALTSHPIQYQVPLFRELAGHQDIDLQVFFNWNNGNDHTYFDQGFNKELKWDIPLLEGFESRFLPNWSYRPSSSFFGQLNPRIIYELFNNQYDAVWIHGYSSLTSWIAFVAALSSRTPIILRGDSQLLNTRPEWKKAVKNSLLTFLFKHISAFLTIGTLNREYYEHYSVPQQKMFSVPYAVDNVFFTEKNKALQHSRIRIKEKLGISPDAPVILYASKMTQRKRAMDLLKAYELIHNRSNTSLIFVGDGVEKRHLENCAHQLNFKQVIFTGFKNQTELPEYFAAADIFVLPSEDEPWGLVINEAMNFGLPVITTDCVGAAKDLVKHDENGFIYPAGNIHQLKHYLLKLLFNPDLRLKMGRMSVKLISNWGFKENVEGILKALEFIKVSSA